MGALFGFVFFWVVLLFAAGVGALLGLIAEKLPESGTFAMILLAAAGFVDWCAEHVRHFFAHVFSICKQISWRFYTEGRKHNEH